MDNKNLSAEELALEQEAGQEVKEDEIRSKVIEDYGFDETTDGERIDKLVAKEVESRKKLSQAIGQKRKYREEAETLKNAPPQKVASKDTKVEEPRLSIKDSIALRDVHEDDVDDVMEYAQLKKMSIAEAKKSDVVQAILSRKAENRKTATATNTGGGKPPIKKLTDEALIAEFEKGNIPEPGTKEAEGYFWAKRGGRR